MTTARSISTRCKNLVFKLNELITVEILAEKLHVSVKTVRDWISLRKIPFTKLGRRVYFSVGVVEQMLSDNGVPALEGQRGREMAPARIPIPTQGKEGGSDATEGMIHG